MTTRLSKIARLPANIREELNTRLHNGQFGRKILPWLNNLHETKEVLAENFDGNPITHQNLSEWRRSGYQDWLFHQQRLTWFTRLHEEDTELSVHDSCPDTYEAMSRYFLFEIGQALAALQKIKNPDLHFTRLQNLTREFSRLQNAYNWSRRVAFEYDKFNGPETDEPEIESPELPEDQNHAQETGDRARPGRSETRPRVSPLGVESSESLVPPLALEVPREAPLGLPASRRPEASNSSEPIITTSSLAENECQGAGALQDPPRTSEADDQRTSPAIAGDCGSPLPLSDINSSTPKLSNSQNPLTPRPSTLPPPNCHPIPTPAPTPTPVISYPPTPTVPLSPRPSKPHTSPIRGRRFVCIEG